MVSVWTNKAVKPAPIEQANRVFIDLKKKKRFVNGIDASHWADDFYAAVIEMIK